MQNKQKSVSLQLLTLITTPKLADKAIEIFKQRKLPLQYRFSAQGTASSDIIDMLGLGDVDKCVIISLLPKAVANDLLHILKVELQMHAVNSGIAFTIPLTGVNNLILRLLAQDNEKQAGRSARKGETGMSETKHVLVAAIINRGFSSNVMEAAKSAGAKGGTVIHSHCLGTEEATGLWGLFEQDEKEIVIILTEAENKLPVMTSISQNCGTHSEAKGLVLSLPIDSAVGI